MREIKFRAWFKDDTADAEMLHFDLINSSGFNIPYIVKNSESLMQYTGFKDKNGVEIFEGDIIRYTPKKGKTKTAKRPYNDMVVLWNDHPRGGWRCIWRWNDKNQRNSLHVCTDENHEVIGNIYENKDLLK